MWCCTLSTCHVGWYTSQGHCHVAALMGLVTQNLAHWLGGACSFCPLLRVIVLVIALVLVGTGSNPAVVVVDIAKFFSTLPQLLLSASRSLHRLERL